MRRREAGAVVVGAGLAGASAARTLREEGFDGRVVLIGEEPHPPYERPPLSKEYLRGEADADGVFVHAPSWYEENDVELVLGERAARLHPGERAVELEGGARVPYDSVLIATGGRNRRLDLRGGDLDGILDLRTLEDANRLRAEARPGRRAVIVGAGLIGCEAAASLRQIGVEVEVVEIFETALLRALGKEIGTVLEAIHRDRGVRFHFREVVHGFEGHRRVEEVVTERGTRIGCDFVLVAVGIVPAAGFAESSGVQEGDGVRVDERCFTGVEGVYAAGDVANHHHPVFGRRMRVEHFDNAIKQGSVAARNMMGRAEVFDDPHWFWSDQYEHNVQYIGSAPQWDELVVRGSIEERRFVAFYLNAGIVDAAAGLDSGRDVRRAGALIRSRARPERSALEDADVDLRKLAAAGQTEE